MNKAPCKNCGEFFPRSPRHKGQLYCKKQECRKAKKAEWQKEKMKTDLAYRAKQKEYQQNWARANPDYWKKYRSNNPESAQRNRILQKDRNRKRSVRKTHSVSKMNTDMIAKMDASNSREIKLNGSYWLIPFSPRERTLKANIQAISSP